MLEKLFKDIQLKLCKLDNKQLCKLSAKTEISVTTLRTVAYSHTANPRVKTLIKIIDGLKVK